MNAVDQMTPAQIEAEKQAILAGVPPQAEPGAAPAAPTMTEDQAQQIAEQNWLPVLSGALPMLAVSVFPQWQLQPAELDGFGKALAGCLEQLFPGGMGGRYACWFRLVAITGGIIVTRKLQHGELPGLGAAPVTDDEHAAAAV